MAHKKEGKERISDPRVLTRGLSPCAAYTEFSAVHFENILRTESGHPLRLTYGGISVYDRIIPELYQKAMLWKDWKEASKGQRR